MTLARLAKLEREWADRLRASGFRDLESPGGWIPSPLSHGVSEARTRSLAHLEQDREGTHRLQFSEPWHARAWEMHLDGHSNRDIARKLRTYRKLIDQTFKAWRKIIRAKGRGRKRDPESMRSHGVLLTVRLAPAHVEALDHVRTLLNLNAPEALRAGIVEFAKRISANRVAR